MRRNKIKQSISERLMAFLKSKGFVDTNGNVYRFNQSDRNYSEVIDGFFKHLIDEGEITHYTYMDETIYQDICGIYAAISFAWFNGKYIDMIMLTIKE